MTADPGADVDAAADPQLFSWSPPPAGAGTGPGGADYGRLVDNLRTLQDVVTGAAPPPELVGEVADRLAAIADLLAPHVVPESRQITGRRRDLPGRGQTLVPVFTVEEWDDRHVTGTVTFGRFHLGDNGAAHGGSVPLLIDEVFGRLANTGGAGKARTAYLHVNFRSVTPVEVELRLAARVDRQEGRKRYLTATLHDGDRLCADAEALFVVLRPGQP